MSILLTYNAEPVLVLFLDYSTHKVHLLTFYSRIFFYSRVLYVLIRRKFWVEKRKKGEKQPTTQPLYGVDAGI